MLRLSLPQHLSYGDGSLHVDAAFQQTLWSVAPISSGSEAAQGESPPRCAAPPRCGLGGPLCSCDNEPTVVRAFCVALFCRVDASHSRLSLTPLFMSDVRVKIGLSFCLRFCQL